MVLHSEDLTYPSTERVRELPPRFCEAGQLRPAIVLVQTAAVLIGTAMHPHLGSGAPSLDATGPVEANVSCPRGTGEAKAARGSAVVRVKTGLRTYKQEPSNICKLRVER
jgi:hypothetical protein